jgi:O-acetyl-ADP-ribose deacetylase (regulator of RNase III)
MSFMVKQGHKEPTGQAKLSPAFNLPSKYVLHTVGPIITHSLTQKDCDLLASCYTSCLRLAEENNIRSIAFCCISTGVFRFPKEKAAEIAVRTVREYLEGESGIEQVVFNVFSAEDEAIYQNILN